MSAADLIAPAAAVARASDDGLEYVAPSNTVAVVAMGTRASESTKIETAAAAVGGAGLGAAPESPRGSSSSATNTSAPVPSGKTPVAVAGNVASPSSGVPPGRGASSSSSQAATPGSAVSPALTPPSGSPSTPISVRAAFTTPPSGAPRPPADVLLSNRENLKLAAAAVPVPVGTSDFEMVDPGVANVVIVMSESRDPESRPRPCLGPPLSLRVVCARRPSSVRGSELISSECAGGHWQVIHHFLQSRRPRG
jgi:hypothetical protein